MKHDANTLYTILADLLEYTLDDYMEDFATPGFKKAVDAAKNAVAGAPVEALSGAMPLVLYFENNEDRDGFLAAVQQAKPGMRSLKI